MELMFSGEECFLEKWNSFLERNPKSTWRYLASRVRFQKVYAQKSILKDLSFILTDGNSVVAICPLFLEQQGERKQFSFSGGYQASPLLSADLHPKFFKKVERACFRAVDELAQKYGVAKTMMLLDPWAGDREYNTLMEFGYIDSSTNTSVVNLSKERTKLWAALRSSYKAIINRGLEKYSVNIMNNKNCDYRGFDGYRLLHSKTSGRDTRVRETFDLQFEMLMEDKAILINLIYREHHVASGFFTHDRTGAYYGSFSDDPEFETNVPLGHCTLWSAIDYYREKGLPFFDVGILQFDTQLFDQPSRKEIGISNFKKGFGGKTVSLHRGIKYYDSAFMKVELMANVEKILSVYVA